MIDTMKLEIFVRFRQISHQSLQSRQQPAVELREMARLDRVSRGVEIVEVRQQDAQCVAHFEIRLADPFENLIRQRDVALIVFRNHPQPKNVGTIFIHVVSGIRGLAG